jgi:hypothetical protein
MQLVGRNKKTITLVQPREAHYMGRQYTNSRSSANLLDTLVDAPENHKEVLISHYQTASLMYNPRIPFTGP